MYNLKRLARNQIYKLKQPGQNQIYNLKGMEQNLRPKKAVAEKRIFT